MRDLRKDRLRMMTARQLTPIQVKDGRWTKSIKTRSTGVISTARIPEKPARPMKSFARFVVPQHHFKSRPAAREAKPQAGHDEQITPTVGRWIAWERSKVYSTKPSWHFIKSRPMGGRRGPWDEEGKLDAKRRPIGALSK